jgi:hypothetical protein
LPNIAVSLSSARIMAEEKTKQQQREEQRPPIPPPDQPLEPISPEERLERDLNLEPRTREANTKQVNESFKPADSLGQDPEVLDPHVDFGGIEAIAKNSFFIADDLGEPIRYQVDSHTYSLLFQDDSIITVRIEARPGKFGGVGFKAFNDRQRELSNESFAKKRGIWQAQLEAQKKRNQEIAGGPGGPERHPSDRTQPQQQRPPIPQTPRASDDNIKREVDENKHHVKAK